MYIKNLNKFISVIKLFQNKQRLYQYVHLMSVNNKFIYI